MGSVNDKFEVVSDVAAATSAGLTLTFTTNTPTASTAQTIADGSSPTVVETGQFMQNINTQVAALIVDVAALRTAQNDGL